MVHKIIKRKPQANLNPSIMFEIESGELLKYCLSLRRWKKRGFLIFRKNFELPRLVATSDDNNVDYACSKITHNKNALTQTFAQLLANIFFNLKIKFNYILLNIYRNGTKSIGWHSDQKINLCNKINIVMLSLRVRQIFRIKYFQSKKAKYFKLEQGCILLMKRLFETNWHRSLSKIGSFRNYLMNVSFLRIFN